MPPATIAIVIATPRGLRHVASACERGAAGPAEDILRNLGAEVAGSSFWVQCADAQVARRLTGYLQDVRAEMMADRARPIG
ncbi:hypothetical protein [Methylobacterium organophilum]|uniref:Uncharacterized protein n=1 Tax=Methylobacterium organophilum TaxID=410 RepID=A0ABQ4TC26_METOR|nr:hypothetical protein [Methylobacterium organophilum]GJE28793.1 hypothetical protein LKMONMHP_3667 [Methylobacterium organophilum]